MGLDNKCVVYVCVCERKGARDDNNNNTIPRTSLKRNQHNILNL